jgi:putative PEP-CTERM system histidine kinase
MTELITLFHLVSAIACIATALAALMTRRLGARSWLLSLFLVPAGMASLALGGAGHLDAWNESSATRAALSLILLSVPGAFLYSRSLGTLEDAARRGAGRLLGALIALPAIAIGTSLFYLSFVEGADADMARIHLRSARYVSGIFLVGAAVVALASLERVIRCAEDHVRWEIKFVVLGLGTPLVSMVYLGSSLLSRTELNTGSLATVTLSLLPACSLIWIGWKRGTERGGGVRISQGLTYSTVTLVGAGLYLLAAGLMATWTTSLLGVGANARALVIVMLCAALVALLMTTRVRHRLRDWVRRHVFSGRYDYRTAWLEASRTIRGNDPPELAAEALCSIVQDSLGSIDVSVWLRDRDGDSLSLLCARGPAVDGLPRHVDGLAETIRDHVDPIAISPESSDTDERVAAFFRQTATVLLVPLRSADETLGVLAVGRNRSGREFDWYSREFLRALTRHAAGEFHKRELLDVLVQAKEDEAFRAFSTFLLHDLKNFSTTLSMVAENAARHSQNPDFLEDAFASIVDTAEKMKRLCGSLRTFSTTAAQDRRPCDLNQIVEDMIEAMRNALTQRLTMRFRLLPTIGVDREEIARVVQNLVLNAAEASPADSEISVETAHTAGEVEIAVRDHGCGISAEFLENDVFTPFRTTKSSGLGIGLFQCRKIVEAHGGRISIESEEERGTTVRVFLPAKTSELADGDRQERVHQSSAT